jgi:chromosome segregation ATPase
MNKNVHFSWIGFFMILLFIPGLILAQDDKKAVELQRLEAGINTAKAKVTRSERKLFVADSLISKGTEQLTESKAEIKSVTAERKTLDKEYATGKKSLEKLAGSKDKAEAAQAKADMKELDMKYKADSKLIDTRLKDATKTSTTGKSNLSKGKTGKKTAEDGLKAAQAALDAAQAKYDAASGTDMEENDGKKKKKK